MHARLSTLCIDEIIATALREDHALEDITTETLIDPLLKSEAAIVTKSAITVCGHAVAQRVFQMIDPELHYTIVSNEGSSIKPGTPITYLRGFARSILAGERVSLNFFQHMSSIATHTKRFIEALPIHTTCKICDTRKTTPTLRILEKYAVRCAGGYNHRFDLRDSILIKDNHIKAVGGSVHKAIEQARKQAPHTSRIECEVTNVQELEEALHANADIIMLDNFDEESIEAAIKKIDKRAIIEVSGNIHIEQVKNLAILGVDFISVGAITQSPPHVDLALDWIR